MANLVKQVFLERVMNHRFVPFGRTNNRRVNRFDDTIIWGDGQSAWHQEWLFGDKTWSLPELNIDNPTPLSVRLTSTHGATVEHPGAPEDDVKDEVGGLIQMMNAFGACFDDIWPNPSHSRRIGYNHYDMYTMVKFKLDWMDRHTLSFANQSQKAGGVQLGEDDVSTQSIHDGY